MKTVQKTIELVFRKERGGAADATKRPSFSVSYAGYEGENETEVIEAEALNSTLESYAKVLVTAKATDWNYRPESAELTLANWHKWYTTSAPRTRAVTAATLDSFATVYAELAVKYLGKSKESATTGAQIIRNKLVPVLGNSAALKVIETNIVGIAEAAAAADDISLDPHESVINYLLGVISDSMQVVTASDL